MLIANHRRRRRKRHSPEDRRLAGSSIKRRVRALIYHWYTYSFREGSGGRVAEKASRREGPEIRSGRDVHPVKGSSRVAYSRLLLPTRRKTQRISGSDAIPSSRFQSVVKTGRDEGSLLPTRKLEPNARTCARAHAITGRNRSAIYYAPLDHHLNANSLITPGANCYALARPPTRSPTRSLAHSLDRARSPVNANFRTRFSTRDQHESNNPPCYAIPREWELGEDRERGANKLRYTFRYSAGKDISAKCKQRCLGGVTDYFRIVRTGGVVREAHRSAWTLLSSQFLTFR